MMFYLYKLSPKEVEILQAVIEGKTFVSLGKNSRGLFQDAVKKIRFHTDLFEDILLEGECDYSREWFISHPKMGNELIVRHQTAFDQACKTFWGVRCGKDVTSIIDEHSSQWLPGKEKIMPDDA